MNLAGFLVIAVLLFGNACIGIAGMPEQGGREATVESYLNAIAQAKSSTERADLHKALGDLYVSREDFKKAAEQYIEALSLYRGFPENERLQMAVYISWGDRLDEAIAELKSIVSGSPGNLRARTHLARTLSWAGRLDEALGEISVVLARVPGDRDALLVKANALSWKGNYAEAVPLYNEILAGGEDYDARSGLAHALLARGDLSAARENMELLRPAYRYQEKDLGKLREELNAATRSSADIRTSYYEDADHNRVNRYEVASGFWVGAWQTSVRYARAEDRDPVRDINADALAGSIYSRPGETLGIGAGLGVNRFGSGNAATYLTAHLKADHIRGENAFGVAVSRNVLDDTAELIEKRIRLTDSGAYLSQTLTKRLFLFGSYHYRDYSDNNDASDLQLTAKYALSTETPALRAGYRFRYLNFNRQSFGGYFDPNDFSSHQIFVNVSYEHDGLSAFAEPYIGYQSFRRYGEKQGDMISGAVGAVGVKLSRHLRFELNAEGGNYALGSATGFHYYMVGLGLHGVF